MSQTIPGFDEDRYFDENAQAPAELTDAYIATECIRGCGRDRVAPDYPMCIVHAATAHYSRPDCRCDGCAAKAAVEICCENIIWNEPCACAPSADLVAAAAA